MRFCPLLVGLLTTALPLDTALSAIAAGTVALSAVMLVVSAVDDDAARPSSSRRV